MLAAKHFDPVVGIDIHLIQPPGPVPPLPIPHPFVGFLIDPADYVPFVGSTVQINGLHRAQAGTAGKCVPPHIPIGGVFVPPPPGNECEMFMGSATVEIDGEAQSFMGLPALSCQSVGMPTIPRLNPKKKTKPKCLMLPLSFVLPIPAGPPVMIGGPPTISISGLAMKAGLAALGKLAKALKKLQKSSKRWKALSDRIHAAAKKAMNKLGIPPNVQNKVHRSICSVTGHPVDVATGKVFTEIVDFQIAGPFPLKWERVYFSTSIYSGPFGRGWHHNYDLALIEQDDAVAVRMSDGRPVAFPRLEVGEIAFDRKERLTLSRGIDGYNMRDPDGLCWVFGRVTFDTDIQVLTSIEDRAGNSIGFAYDKYGCLESIRDSARRTLPVRTDAEGRIIEIGAPHPDEEGQMIRLASYAYDDSGRLIEVRDALDQPMTYQYDGRLLSKETNRNGLSFYFEYDDVNGESARCVRTWGDDGIYNHRLEYDVNLHRTVVTDSLDRQTTYLWNEDGMVIRTIDAAGIAVETVYNDFNELIVELDELGQQTTYDYDDRGNTTTFVEADGSTLQVAYNEHDLPLRAVNHLGHVWEWEFDSRGLLTRHSDAAGAETRYEYASHRLSTIVDHGEAVSKLSYDADGNVAGITTVDGSQSRIRYDALGRPTIITAPGRRVHRTKYDLLGQVTEVTEPDGNSWSLAYDGFGNMIRATNPDRDIRLTYQGMGVLVSLGEAGNTLEFRYNTEEDLTGIVNEQGDIYRRELDERNHLTREYGFDGVRRIYTRDDAGRIIRIERASGRISHFEYDSGGRVTAIRYSDGSEETFAYREDGELIEATNNSCTVKFERDPVGRVLQEWQDDYWISSESNDDGLRTESRSCFGAVQKTDRNVMGYMVGMRYSDAAADPAQVIWESLIDRDESGLELQRSLPAGILSRWERDKPGRPVRHQVVGGTGQFRDVRYDWDVDDRLKRIIDANHGTTVLEHDSVGNLAAATYGDGTADLRMPDAIGNLFRTRDRSDREFGPGGRLLKAQISDGLESFEYDEDGNRIRRSTPEGDWLYAWDGAGMLKCIQRPDGESVSFEYDALGRRISKTYKGRKTRWIWDGHQPLHEWTEGEPHEGPYGPGSKLGTQEPLPKNEPPFMPAPSGLITWLFEPESFVPAAMVTRQLQYSIVTDHIGAPTLLLDTSGSRFWSASISAYGELRDVEGDRHACPFRWPGQYDDAETGLRCNGFRYYDTNSGQYINQDPIGIESGIYNLYRYVSDPYRLIDPLGLDWNYRLVDSGGDAYYHGRASDNQSMADVANRHSNNTGHDGARMGPTDKLERITPVGTPKDTVRGVEQRGAAEKPLLGRDSPNVRGNKIDGISAKKQKTPKGKKRLRDADALLGGKKPSAMPALGSHTKPKCP